MVKQNGLSLLVLFLMSYALATWGLVEVLRHQGDGRLQHRIALKAERPVQVEFWKSHNRSTYLIANLFAFSALLYVILAWKIAIVGRYGPVFVIVQLLLVLFALFNVG